MPVRPSSFSWLLSGHRHVRVKDHQVGSQDAQELVIDAERKVVELTHEAMLDPINQYLRGEHQHACAENLTRPRERKVPRRIRCVVHDDDQQKDRDLESFNDVCVCVCVVDDVR